MNYIKSLTQQRLCLMLAVYIGLFLNGAVLFRRLEDYLEHFTARNGIFAVIELFGSVLATFCVLRLLSLFGRRPWQILATLIVIVSAAASYYMTFMNVVIGYGIIASVMTTDIDLSKEVVGQGFILWTVATSLPPLFFIWSNRCRYTLLRQLRTRGQRVRHVAVVLMAGLLVWAPIRVMEQQQKKIEKATGVDMPSYGGVVANSYLPSNWLSALGLYAWAQVDESSDYKSLINPAKKFTYNAPGNALDDTYVVFIIGETTRWDHMGILGYERETTPKLAQEKNLVAFRGYSCDTATKLSLRCMFVREGGADDNPQRTLKEQNVFAVLKQLGFSSDLFAMQSEMWFYSNTMADNIAYREQIGAEPRNRGKNVDDMLLLNEMSVSLKEHEKGKHLLILHTKGSHYSYYQRYTRDFAKWQPECVGINKYCSKQELINAYDNSVLYVDTFISQVLDQLRDKKAIVFYAADHGESINEQEHLHGTPRKLAPPEQFRVPMMVWMSDKYLENPANADAFAHLKQQAEMKVPRRHVELYDTIMGCLGYTSPNGGINENNNWCHNPNTAKGVIKSQ
ncbi:lipopolysaccharide phosphoethanolamine transferase [Trabulsiella guamensis ATCC 49490]|uniref:Lipopolysaccharide phosphoethanolamine transferase n=1 Tax=Trabulsiella guamensis ATCC 49490 TaxID=1005994 RepID=A0A085A2R7_9ENTR|nr:kdo(2)-lipid A phosphoethanolamine 7''-transferase [Trabulsiella guamensis]KFC04512.1 lipopolysaccharide phosphoethanolamine transferase [Trabulsiella guamensis ATCC 49490]